MFLKQSDQKLMPTWSQSGLAEMVQFAPIAQCLHNFGKMKVLDVSCPAFGAVHSFHDVTAAWR